MFAQGQSVEMDYIEAYGWIYQSAIAKDPQATKNLEQLKRILGPKLPEAELRARAISDLIQHKK
jgi:TPR repeat protein